MEIIECKHCKKEKNQHQPITFNCPLGSDDIADVYSFLSDQFFESKEEKKQAKEEDGNQWLTTLICTLY